MSIIYILISLCWQLALSEVCQEVCTKSTWSGEVVTVMSSREYNSWFYPAPSVKPGVEMVPIDLEYYSFFVPEDDSAQFDSIRLSYLDIEKDVFFKLKSQALFEFSAMEYCNLNADTVSYDFRPSDPDLFRKINHQGKSHHISQQAVEVEAVSTTQELTSRAILRVEPLSRVLWESDSMDVHFIVAVRAVK